MTGFSESPVFDGQPEIGTDVRPACAALRVTEPLTLDRPQPYVRLGASYATKLDFDGNRVWTRFFRPDPSSRMRTDNHCFYYYGVNEDYNQGYSRQQTWNQHICYGYQAFPVAISASPSGNLVLAGNYMG